MKSKKNRKKKLKKDEKFKVNASFNEVLEVLVSKKPNISKK